jgi:hypothetical protein
MAGADLASDDDDMPPDMFLSHEQIGTVVNSYSAMIGYLDASFSKPYTNGIPVQRKASYRSAFMDGVFENRGILPHEVESAIESKRGGMSRKDFLLSHEKIFDFHQHQLGNSPKAEGRYPEASA